MKQNVSIIEAPTTQGRFRGYSSTLRRLINRFYNLGAVQGFARKALRSVGTYNQADTYCVGNGLEIGALSVPFRFTNAQVRYADICSAREMRLILDSIPIPGLYRGSLVEPEILMRPPTYDLPSISNGSLDFVYSSHSLEHCPNPIFAIAEYLRVVKVGGHIYSIIPNKEATYDFKRKTTPVQQLIRKYQDGVFIHTLAEAMDVVENTVGHPLYSQKGRDFAEIMLYQNSGIHHFHTFDPRSTVEMIDFCSKVLRCTLVYMCVEGVNIHFCLRR